MLLLSVILKRKKKKKTTVTDMIYNTLRSQKSIVIPKKYNEILDQTIHFILKFRLGVPTMTF